jgi:hypothetical protein
MSSLSQRRGHPGRRFGVLELRSTRKGRTQRLVMIGSLESADLSHWNRAFIESLNEVSAVRLIVAGVTNAERDTFRIVRHQVGQARALGVDCHWVSPQPVLCELLREFDEDAFIQQLDDADHALLGRPAVIGRAEHRVLNDRLSL